ATREGGLKDRVEEVRARLKAFLDHKEEPAPGKPEDPKRAKLVERVTAAMPSIAEASDAMGRAKDSLAAKKTKPAGLDEDAALNALADAIEQFADLKSLVELAYVQEKETTALLSPEAAKELEPAVRAKRTKDGIARNRTRLARLKALIAEERAGID